MRRIELPRFRPSRWGKLAGGILAFSIIVVSAALIWIRNSSTPESEPQSSAASTTPAGTLLTWRPPPCGDETHSCVELQLSDTGSNQTIVLEDDHDYRIHLPADRPLRGGIHLENAGRNVIIIGGEIELTAPCSDVSSSCRGISISKPFGAGEVYIEGVWIRNPVQFPPSCPPHDMACSTGDGIVHDDDPTHPTDVTLQNVRIDGISGCSGGPDHSDLFQPYYAPNQKIRIDNLTGSTNCQGLHVDPALAYIRHGAYPEEIIMKNVNIHVTPNPYLGDGNRYIAWLTFQHECNSGPVVLENFYADQPDGDLHRSAWPDTNQPELCKSVWNPKTKQLSFPSSPQIHGVINFGVPPGGDFVPIGQAGLGYVSPGYR